MGEEVGGFVHRRLRIVVPLRHPDFRLLWTGMTVSLLGDGITTIALAWQAYELSDAPTAFSMVGFSMAVPHVVLLLVGGAVSDRFDRRKVMLMADLIRMAAVTALGLLAVYDLIEIWHMMALAALYGAGTAFFGPAFDAIVPDLVPEDELPQANSLDQFVRPAAFRMLGPALGGWLIHAFGGRAGDAFLIDGFTFAISIGCLILMRSRRRAPEEDEEPSSMFGQIKEGFSYVRTQVWLWGTFLAATLAYLIFWGPAEVLLPFVVKEEMGRSAGELGLIFAMGGVGAMFAAVVMGNREMPRRHMTFMYLAWTLSTLMVAGYGLATMPWQAMAYAFMFNALESAGLIVWITTKQRLVPGRLLGRVSSFDWFISIGLVPLSYAFTGPVAEALGARTTLVGAGLLGGLVTISFLFLPGMRRIERTGALAGADLELVSEPGLGALESPAPPSHEPSHVARPLLVDDEIVGQHQETLARLREALVRWQDSRAHLDGEIGVLEREEHVLEREIELARSRLVDVRTRLAVLRGLRDHYEVAAHQVAEGLDGLPETGPELVPEPPPGLAAELDVG
jgi:DHA3 family tetracycline resistance protein-like MFS transporter